MNQIKIGNYIQQKRKEKNLTQEQFSEKLGVSNKTISKWECGKSLPDYSLVEAICKTLEISTIELFNGEDTNKFDDKQIIEILERIQKLENQKKTIFGILLIIMGLSCSFTSQFLSGSNLRDFLSGVLLGLSIGEMIIGTFITTYSFFKQ